MVLLFVAHSDTELLKTTEALFASLKGHSPTSDSVLWEAKEFLRARAFLTDTLGSSAGAQSSPARATSVADQPSPRGLQSPRSIVSQSNGLIAVQGSPILSTSGSPTPRVVASLRKPFR